MMAQFGTYVHLRSIPILESLARGKMRLISLNRRAKIITHNARQCINQNPTPITKLRNLLNLRQTTKQTVLIEFILE